MSAPSRPPRRNKHVSINLSIHRTITQTCLIICFIICLSLLISPVESLRKAKRKPIAAHHSEVAASDEVFLNQAISEPVNQSNDQSVELQPANQSPPPTEPLADKVDDVLAKEPTVPQNTLADQVDQSAELLVKEPTKPQYQRSYPADEFFKTPSESNKVDDQSVAEPVQKQRIVEVPTKPVNRARSSIYRSSNQSPKSIRQNQPSEQDVPVVSLNTRKPRHQHSPDEDVPLGSLDAPKISRHHHSANEEVPIGVIDKKDSSDDQRVDGVVVGAIHSGHSDHEPGKQSDDVSESPSQQDSQPKPSDASLATDQPVRYSECLSDEAAKQIKEKTKTNLLGIMKNYQAIWALEGRSDDDIRQLINEKSRELAGVLKAQKAELAKQLCTPAAASTPSNDQSPEGADTQSNGVKKRASLYDRLSKVSVDQSNKADSVQADGTPADLVPGGIARHLLSFDEVSLIETEDDEDEDDRVYVSSIHPYHHEPDAPSAYTELSERDIASRHESVDDQIMNEDDDDFGPGFRATITPTRLTDLEISTLALRTARDIEEEIAEEKRRRIERLKARRGIVIASIMPVADAQSHNDEHQQIGHFVASIKPQHSSPIFEEDLMKEAYKTKSFKPVRAGITAPKKQSSPEEKVEFVPSKSSREWMKSEGSSSRSRLARMVRGE